MPSKILFSLLGVFLGFPKELWHTVQTASHYIHSHTGSAVWNSNSISQNLVLLQHVPHVEQTGVDECCICL